MQPTVTRYFTYAEPNHEFLSWELWLFNPTEPYDAIHSDSHPGLLGKKTYCAGSSWASCEETHTELSRPSNFQQLVIYKFVTKTTVASSSGALVITCLVREGLDIQVFDAFTQLNLSPPTLSLYFC